MRRSDKLITAQAMQVAELAGRFSGIIETARRRIQSIVDHEMVRAYS
jgi:hypothetical protein